MTTITSFLVSFFSVALMFQGPAHYKVEGRYAIPGEGGFDYVTLDTSARRLYVSHSTQVDVLDADSGKVVGTIPDTPGVHGVAQAAPAPKRRRAVIFYWAEMPTVVCNFTTGGGFHLPVSASDFGA